MILMFRMLGLPTAVLDTGNLWMLITGLVLSTVFPYLLGSVNSALIVSYRIYGDDVRKYGSGNAGLTNMNRVYGGRAAVLTFTGDVLKQVVSVFIGVLTLGQIGAYISGMFCMLGHIAPVFYRFKGGKGVLTAATLILLIDWQVFLILALLFLVTVLITRYVSLGSLLAAFALPTVVFYTQAARSEVGIADPYSLICSVVIGLIIFLTHSSNIKRLANGTENKISFGKKAKFQDMLDKEDPENDRIRDKLEAEAEMKEKEDLKNFKEYKKQQRRNAAKKRR